MLLVMWVDDKPVDVGHLTIRPVALSGYGSIAHEAKPNGPLIRGL